MEKAEITGKAQTPAKIAFVGANGRMGKFFMGRAKDKGVNIVPVVRPYTHDQLAQLQNANLCIISVPVKCFGRVLEQITPHLPKNAILADITSVKEMPMAQMEKIWPGPVIGTHPLFGPNPGDDLPVVLVKGKNATETQLESVKMFFEKLGCRVFESTASKHDQAMARIQNMNFITNLAYFAVLAGQEDLLPFLTPSFERRKNAAAKMLTEDASMFAGLFEANGYSHEAVRQYRRMLNLAASGDIELLCRRAQWWWKSEDAGKPISPKNNS